ncbi:hypothetical protein [Listeria rocourtiae]|uniref:hypothetical protein n=1 Tax=Listeria rocourtiae TaxID=647910 RepID=UPI003D2F807B
MSSRRNRKIIFIALIFTIVLLSALFFANKSDTDELASRKKQTIVNPIFMQGNGYVSLNKDEVFSLSIPFLYGDTNIADVESISFNDSSINAEFTNITGDYVFDEDTNVNSFNFDISFSSLGNYPIKELTIVTSKKTITVSIGNFIFEVLDSSDDDLSLFGNTVGIQSDVTKYLLSIANDNKESTIFIKDIYAKTDALSILSDNIEIAPNNTFSKELSTSIDVNDNKYSWYLIKPKIDYLIKDEAKIFLSNATYMGLIDISQNQVDLTLKNKQGSEFN